MELCINGGWTGVCDVTWDYKDAFVVCRQLGFPATGTHACMYTLYIAYVHMKTYESMRLLSKIC